MVKSFRLPTQSAYIQTTGTKETVTRLSVKPGLAGTPLTALDRL
jgi:hypothetical protein